MLYYNFINEFLSTSILTFRPLSFAHKISTTSQPDNQVKEKVWNLDLNDDDVDLLDPDTLLDDQDLVKPDPGSLKGECSNDPTFKYL